MTRRTLPELWGVTEMAKSLAVSESTVHDWREKDGFPAPAYRFAMGPAWEAQGVRAWRRDQVKRQRDRRAF